MTISQHAEQFAGQPVRDYSADNPTAGRYVYRLSIDYDDDTAFPDLLDRFLNDHGGPQLTALVIGACDSANDANSSQTIMEALIDSRDRMPNLKALFFGDITFDEREMSWIEHGDLSRLLPAFPRLEEFRIRGTSELTFGDIRHPNITSFAIESGGLPERLLEEVFAAELPRLERLELWLGDEGYGGISTVDPLIPLLSGSLFPHLKYLGLRNSMIQDQVAQAVAASPILSRLEELDLSLGNIGDEGGTALLNSPAVKKLKLLNLQHHFISDRVAAELGALGIRINLNDKQKADGEYRFNMVSE